MASYYNYRDRDFNTGTCYTRMRRYVNSIYPDHVRKHVQKVLEDVNPGRYRYRYAAALTRHVHQEVEYSKEGALWRADYILDETGKGDCEDQAALLASLLVCRSFDIRYVVVRKENGENGHVMLEVLFEDVELDDLIEEANQFYSRPVWRLAWEQSDDGYWLLCNPVASPITGTDQSKYFNRGPDGQVNWKQNVLKDYLEP